MRRSFVWAVLGGCGCVSLVAACSDGAVIRRPPLEADAGQGNFPGTGNGGDNAGGSSGVVPAGQGVGDACTDAEPCRDGLSCNAAGECEPSGATEPGGACVISAECQDGQCVARHCLEAGPGEAGAACLTGAECAAGLRCNLIGLTPVCAPEGDGDLGSACALSSDCFAGLGCFEEKCAVPPPGTPPFVTGSPWQGVECEPPVSTGVKAYFEVPGAAGADEGDFFRLPFPTDVRRSGNKLDLSKFPTPGAGLFGVDPVQLYVDAVSENDSAWGSYPSVLFRFSGPIDGSTFPIELIDYIDLTEQSSNLGWQRFYTIGGRSNYVCENFVGVQPPFGSPLQPGHTYAVVILGEAETKTGPVTMLAEDSSTACAEDADCPSGVCALHEQGNHCEVPVLASANMAAVLGDAVPKDAKLKAAHAAFAPLRAYLPVSDPPIAASSILTATVFTVGEVRQPMTELAAAVQAADPPTASDWVKCDDAAVSPCPQAEGARGCEGDPAGYDEYQALLTLPVFQQGTPPYLTPEDGGGIDTTAPREEQVCLSITVPEGAPPTEGWPAVVFAHGTGGSYRSHVQAAVAGVLAGATPKFAVIGIDQVEHGPRRGESLQSPNNLFFNFLNPAAARGNPLQGAADQLSVARFAKDLVVSATDSGGEEIHLDGAKLFFFGHSQGSTEGSLMLPFGDDYKAAVLSGNGASLRDALRTKTKPENIAAGLPFVLQDPAMSDPNLGGGVTLHHPVLSLLQQWIDPADPLNFAALLGSPLAPHTGKHVFQTFGIDDSYSPPITIATFARAGGFVEVPADASVTTPFTDIALTQKTLGYFAASPGFTLGMRQYGAPQDSDGHFVVFDNETANADMVLFLAGAAGTNPPVIGQ